MKMFSHLLVHAMLIILALWTTSINSMLTTSSNANYSDRMALIAIKEKITGDPHGVLSSWNDSVHYCEWSGVYCSRRHPHRVTELDLRFQKLEGTLSPYIGNLSFLREIGLTENRFYGPIPQEIGRLFRLQFLFLNNNSFVGEIPTNLTHCSDLRKINLVDNNLSGGIPVELTSLSKLTALGIGKSLIKGSIPSSLANLSSLLILSIRECSLSGSIPNDLCRISSLQFLILESNSLTGTTPSCLYNLSQITVFAISGNQLEGRVPRDIGLTLPNLQGLYLSSNKFTGPIPLSLVNASRLEVIELSENQFTGQVPRDSGRLQALRSLVLHSNQLGSTTGDDLNFITSLTNCTNLEYLEVGNNSLKGSIPNSIANLSTQITWLNLRKNQIHGRIPAGIENLVNLNVLEFARNYLTGEIPKAIIMFSKMHKLFFDTNQFSGEIPDIFHNLTQLEILDFSENGLHGNIPTSLKNCKNLREIYLYSNRLNGTIPKQVFGIPTLVTLVLFNNSFSGSLPTEMGDLTNLETLHISSNRMSGRIPDSLGNGLMLRYLYMDGNLLEGKIPQSLRSVRGIEEIHLSHNILSGDIPEYFVNFTFLKYFDLSYNELEGPVPKGGVFANATAISVDGNPKLCGGVAELKLLPCHIQTLKKKKRKSFTVKIIIPVFVVSLFLVLLSCLLFTRYGKRLAKNKPSSTSFFDQRYMRISYAKLLKATNGFSVGNLIGVGSYGSVYKGILDQDQKIVAVKVLNLQQRGASKSFLYECNVLRNLRHRNLVKIITSCSSVDFQGNDFKALIFEFMPNGSLQEWLHSERDEQHGLRNLSFSQRLNMAIDVASALDYLHHDCQPAVVHCDLKPSNVLLDDDMTAHVADFGLAKIFSATSCESSQSQSNSLAIKGTIGYVAPEYGMGSEVSKQGDVYSYGILLLEMFTGMAPTNDMFRDGRNLHGFAKVALPEHVMNIVDPTMFLEESYEANRNEIHRGRRARMQKCLVSVISLGVACSTESPIERMSMGDVVTELCHVKDYHQGLGNI